MSKIVVYHGSGTEVKEPSLEYGRYDDFNNEIIKSHGTIKIPGLFMKK